MVPWFPTYLACDAPSLYYNFANLLNNLVSLFSCGKSLRQVKSKKLALCTHRDGQGWREQYELADWSHFQFLNTVFKEVPLFSPANIHFYNPSSFSRYPESVFLEFEITTESPRGYMKTQVAGPLTRFLIQSVWGGAWVTASLRWCWCCRSGPHLRNDCPRWLFHDFFFLLKAPIHIAHPHS